MSDTVQALYAVLPMIADSGREISQNQGSELIIHCKNCQVQRFDSHDGDPNPPKDGVPIYLGRQDIVRFPAHMQMSALPGRSTR